MEMCWRRTAAASARGARQWRCAGEDQRRQAQGVLANGDVLARSSCGQRKRRSPMEICWQRAGAASARGACQWRCAGEEQLRQAQGALPNGDVLEKSSGGKRKGRSPMEMGWQDSCGKCRRRSPMEMCWRRGPVASYIFSLSFIYYLCGRDIYLSIYIFALYSILV